jgi:GT2 family glycosyltransferase
MKEITVIIPNYNGMKYLEGCLDSLRRQTDRGFDVVMIDNGSDDGSVSFVREHYPEVRVRAYHRNTGFCRAVNAGIRMARTRYVLLLNNDVVCSDRCVEYLHRAIAVNDRIFSCQAKLVSMQDPALMDDGGDHYCALGWAFAAGKGKKAENYGRCGRVFSCCAAAAIYNRETLQRIGLFDEAHFAYLEDVDLGYRAQIYRYDNYYMPAAVVMHAGSATSGSRHNAFKVRLAARNNLYVIRKNMPHWQIALNFPLLLAGTLIKGVYFMRRGLGRAYLSGLKEGLSSMNRLPAAPEGHIRQYLAIQMMLWKNCGKLVKELLHD